LNAVNVYAACINIKKMAGDFGDYNVATAFKDFFSDRILLIRMPVFNLINPLT
jgi:hypothetical protein